MISNAEPLENAAVAVLDVARSLIESGSIRTLTDDDLTTLATTAGTILRGIEAILIETAGEVEARSTTTAKEERFAVKRGCRDAVEFLQRATGVGGSAAGWVRGARMVRGGVSLTTGEALPPALPGIRTALGAGTLTADALLTLSPVVAAQAHASVELIDLADRALSEVAAGVGALPVTAAELRNHAVAWSVLLDQDGQEPGEDTGAKRALHLTPAGDGYLKINGTLVPEVGAVLQRILDSLTNPRAKGVRFESSGEKEKTPRDPRTPAQQRHDALATALNIAASAAEMPTVTGAAPTLVVHVTEHAALTGTGRAFIDGNPVTTATARHTGCVGTIHRVTTAADGRIRAIHTTDRVFNIYQRRAIELRDGGCVIPGCAVKAAWCEIHHVREWQDGGETHTDNGVLLCWYHHRYLDTNGWNIRTTNGTPETRAPAWIDPRREWRKVPPPAHRISTISRT